jgi:glycerophosphoryl diester phosphodiesterase
MDTIKFDKGTIKMIAHRGLSAIERENTCPAFVAAANRSYWGIETDIHVTADGKFVVIHDETPERVSNGAWTLNVEESTAEQLQQVLLPDLDGSTHRPDIRLPFLEDYIAICKKYGKVAVLELKNLFPEDQVARVVEELRRLEYLEGTVFISFKWDNCVALRKLLPEHKIQYLVGSAGVTQEKIDKMIAHRFDLDVRGDMLSKNTVDQMHAAGLEVNVWTIDKPEYAEMLKVMGVDYITTNILE